MAYPTSGQWSTPLEETNGNARRPSRRFETNGSQERIQSAYRDPKPTHRSPSDVYNIMSDSEEIKQRRVSLKANNLSTSRKRSRNTLLENGKAAKGERVDDSAWIHRDKLAQIEIQELEEAGIYVRPARRSMSADPGASRRSSRSASRSRRPMSDDALDEPLPNGGYIANYDGYDDTQERHFPGTPPAREEHVFDPDLDTEFRTPEEIAAEREFNYVQLPRPSTSRIPISKASPVPVPLNMVGRESPLPRSRHGSMGSGNWDEMHYARRARSGSIGSQVILDEDTLRTPYASGSSNKQSSAENSPPKARMPTKGTPKSGARKGSGANGVDRPGSSYGKDRKVSTPSSQRPQSRAGSAQKNGRPSTSHQHVPEGDPPWIDSMYKPDPRLPPDQQMLPTHAKRMMQEQWEKEGKTGSTYDRDLNLMSDKELPTPRSKPQPLNLSPNNTSQNLNGSPRKQSPAPNSTSDAAGGSTWPPPPRADIDMPPPSPRPSTKGGFKLTPKVSPPPVMQKFTPPPAATAVQPAQSSLRVPELDEKEEAAASKKGGCGCCVVM